MTRSLRNWLASLFLLAAPGVAFGQNYVGQPHLTPVALEARCRVADGMLDSWPNFHVTGASPLHVAMLSLKESRSTPISQSDSAAKSDSAALPSSVPTADVASELDLITDFGCSAESVPACYAADATDNHNAIASPSSVEAVAAESKTVIESDSKSPITNFQPSPDFCPFADFVQKPVAAEVANKELLAEIAANEPIDVSYLEVVRAETTNEYSFNKVVHGSSTVGSGPIVVTLAEEYVPYDLSDSDAKKTHPITIRILNLPAPNYCMLPPHAMLPSGLEVNLAEYLPSDEQRDFLQHMAQPEPNRFPLDCWMDELIWRTSDLLDPDGPVVSQLDASRLGTQIADLTLYALSGVVEYSQPVVSILAHPVAPQQPAPQQPAPQQPAGQQFAGQQFAVQPRQQLSELAVAGTALISVAEDLESLAAALRGWGASINRVALADQPLNR